MKYTLLHTAAYPVTSVAAALASEGVTAKLVHEPTDLTGTDQPTAFLLDPSSRSSFSVVQLRRFIQAGGAVVLLGAVDEHDVPDAVPDDVVSAYVTYPYAPRRLLVGLRTAYAEAAARRDAFQVRREAALRSKELRELTRIGMALTTERDYNTLLELILSLALQITDSDAASLYIVERPEDEPQRLRFKLSQNVSRPDIPFVEFTMPLDMQSIAGNVAVTGQPLAIDDVYDLPGDVEYTFNRSFDEQYGYRSKSMLTIPMKDHKEEIIGVLQLINRKRHGDQKLAEPRDFERGVVPYSHRQVDLVSALAGQAAVSIENSQLYEDIERLFEGFVRASVTAIEQRDPTTFGHSGRVASMTVALAETVDRSDDGPYRHVAFSREDVRQIRYAGLLHDFGKVGVREQVLVKAKKLYPSDLALLKQRYAFIRRTAESDFHRQRADYLEQHGQRGYGDFATRLRHDYDMRLAELDEFIQLVLKSNEPTVLPDGSQRIALTRDATRTRQYSQPTWSPSGERIAWAEVRAQGGELVSFLHVGYADGSQPQELDLPFAPFYIYWSPDAQKLVYLSNWLDNNLPSMALRMVSLSADGLDAKTLGQGQPYYFSWAPDGQQLLTHVGDERVSIRSLDGAEQTLSNASSGFPAPQWSPDGASLVYTLDEAGLRQLIVTDTSGELQQVITDYDGIISFSLNPQGNLMAYTVSEQGGTAAAFGPLYVVDIETGRTQQLSQSRVFGFFWSPDGAKLAYMAVERVQGRTMLRWRVWEDAGQQQYELFVPSGVFLERYLAFFDQYAQSMTIWSPDSSAFTYAGVDSNLQSGVWIQRLDAEKPQRISNGVISLWSPR